MIRTPYDCERKWCALEGILHKSSVEEALCVSIDLQKWNSNAALNPL